LYNFRSISSLVWDSLGPIKLVLVLF